MESKVHILHRCYCKEGKYYDIIKKVYKNRSILLVHKVKLFIQSQPHLPTGERLYGQRPTALLRFLQIFFPLPSAS